MTGPIRSASLTDFADVARKAGLDPPRTNVVVLRAELIVGASGRFGNRPIEFAAAPSDRRAHPARRAR